MSYFRPQSDRSWPENDNIQLYDEVEKDMRAGEFDFFPPNDPHIVYQSPLYMMVKYRFCVCSSNTAPLVNA